MVLTKLDLQTAATYSLLLQTELGLGPSPTHSLLSPTKDLTQNSTPPTTPQV